MKSHLNTNLFPIISVAMYESFLSPDNFFNSSQIDEDKQEGYINFDSEYFDDNFQNDFYVEAVQTCADYFLSGFYQANGIEIEIKTGQIYSPKYYNYATDQIDLEVKFNKTKVLKYAKDHQGELDYFLNKHFTSYEGFNSHTANNYQDWLQDFKDNNVQSIGAVLTFIFEDDLYEFREGFYEYCHSNLYYTQFVDTTSIDAEQKIIEDYVCNNYQDVFLNSFLDDLYEFDFEHFDKDDILAVAVQKIKDIDSHTLELELI
jgi:hypothetical protein